MLQTIPVFDKVKTPLQVILREARPVPIYFEDLTEQPSIHQQESIQAYAVANFQQPFDLRKEVLCRMAFFKLEEAHWACVFTYHHILMDGWSAALLADFFLQNCAARLQGNPLIKYQNPHYFDLITGLKLPLDQQELSKIFWSEEIEGVEATHLLDNFGCDRKQTEKRVQTARWNVPAEALQAMQLFCKTHQITVATYFLTNWVLVLHKLLRQDCLVVGNVFSGRGIATFNHQTIGLFAQTFPLVAKCDATTSFIALALSLQQKTGEMLEHQDFPIASIQQAATLFDHVFVYENYNIAATNASSAFSGFEFKSQSHYPLVVGIYEQQATVEVCFTYHEAVIPAPIAEQLLQWFASFLQDNVHLPTRPLQDFRLAEVYTQQTFHRASHWHTAYPPYRVEYLLSEVKKHQGLSVALETEEGKQQTYTELWEQSGRLAAWLQTMGGHLQGRRVGLHLPSGRMEMVGLMVALWRLGAAYVPISPELPLERKRWMATDSEIIGLVTLSAEPLQDLGISCWVLPEELPSQTEDLPWQEDLEAEAYLLYTSGTTGTPKGCSISHRNLVRLLCPQDFPFEFGNTDRWCVLHQWGFDFSVWELWGGLLYGGRVLLLSRETVQDVPRLVARLHAYGLTVLNQTPQAFYGLQSWLSATNQWDLLPQIRYIIFGGDKLSPTALTPWTTARGYCAPQLVNMYGITETTVHVTYHFLTAKDNSDQLLGSPVGVPLAETQVWVMDVDGQLLPAGFWGELWIGGSGVSQAGYHNRESLNTTRFISHPRLGRLYRSGDVGMWTETGQLRHNGRIDRQLKLRGHRVEATEIESVVRQVAGIRQAYAHVDEAGRLVLYYVGEAAIDTLQTYVAQHLPTYAHPQHWVALETLPLTANGKVAEKQLPPISSQPFTAIHQTPLEGLALHLATLWGNLLGISKEGIGLTDNFFALGGDSVQAIQLISRLAGEGYRISLRDFLTNPTIDYLSKLCSLAQPSQAAVVATVKVQKLRSRLHDQVKVQFEPIEAEKIEAVYELSPAQAGMLAGWLRYGSQGAYYEQMTYVLQSSLPAEAWQFAWENLVTTEPMLRTSFVWEGVEEPAQVVWQAGSQPTGYSFVDWSTQSEAIQKASLQAYCAQRTAEGIDVAKLPLMRLQVCNLGKGRYAMVWEHSHLLMDGWCLQPLMEAFRQTAMNYPKGLNPASTSLSYQGYLDYLSQIDQELQQSYWRTYLSGLTTHTTLPGYRSGQGYQVAEQLWQLDTAASEALKHLGQRWGVRLAVLWQGLWAGLLAGYQGSDGQDRYEVLTGLLSSGRPAELAGIEGLIGLFVQALPLRVQATSTANVRQTMEQMQQAYNEWQAHQYTSVSAIQQAATHLEAPLYNHVLVVENYPYQAPEADQKWNFETLTLQEQTHFDLNWIVYPPQQEGQAWQGKVLFNRMAIDEVVVQQLIARMKLLITRLVSEENQATLTFGRWIASSPAEIEQVSHGFNQTQKPYPQEPITALIRQNALQYAEKIAVKDSQSALSYTDFEALTSYLATQLIALGVQPGDRVGVMVGKNVGVALGLVAILKAGGVYTPLESGFPAARLQFMLQDAAIQVAMVDEDFVNRFDTSVTLLRWQPILHQNAWKNTPHLAQAVSLADPAFMVYTSGSTGNPKGVLQTHRCLANLIRWNVEDIGLTDSEVILQMSAFGFDASIHEVLLALGLGATLVSVAEEEKKQLPVLQQKIIHESVTLLWLPITLLNTVLEMDAAFFDPCTSLRAIVATGEQLKVGNALRQYLLLNPQVRVLNYYGPSETHVVTYFEVNASQVATLPPIGKPIRNSTIYVVNSQGELLPPYALGEIEIGGENLALGYQNLPELTTARFRQLPTLPEKTYKSGDLGYWDAQGNLHFCGRADDQIKIRGFRVEPIEVEQGLLQIEEVQAVSVIYQNLPDGSKGLVAYLVCQEGMKVDHLRAQAAQWLPEFMLPAFFVLVDRIPLNTNGKVDKAALMQWPLQETNQLAEQWSSATEQQLAEVWQSLLGGIQIHRTSHFFQVGGHSLKAIQLSARVHQKWRKSLPLSAIYQTPRLADMAVYLDNLPETDPKVADYATEDELGQPFGLTSAQRKIWAFQQLFPYSEAYWIKSCIDITGDLQVDKLVKAWQIMLLQYPILRTRVFVDATGNPVQQIMPVFAYPLLPAASDMQPLATQVFPLFVLRLDKVGEQQHQLWVAFSHLLLDGISIHTLSAKLIQVYGALCAGQQVSTQVVKPTFLDYARSVSFVEVPGQNQTNWEGIAEQHSPHVFMYECRNQAALTAICQEANITEATWWMVLLQCLQRWTTDATPGVAIAHANRPEAYAETLGLFVSLISSSALPSEEVSLQQALLQHQQWMVAASELPIAHSAMSGQWVMNYWEDLPTTFYQGGVKLTVLQAPISEAKFPVEIQIRPQANSTTIQFVVSPAAFGAEDAAVLFSFWQKLAETAFVIHLSSSLSVIKQETITHLMDEKSQAFNTETPANDTDFAF
ncbi:MAG TPA: hypothetical protein DCM08_06185 [Microscillaceae bacterium]|nr:hypothetical protein [Microscillaceae bacterium]